MVTRIHITGQWVAVASYVTIDNAGHLKNAYDGGLFNIATFTVIEGDLKHPVIESPQALVSFEHLVNQGYRIGDTFAIDGQVQGANLAIADEAAANEQRIAKASAKLITFANDWAKKHLSSPNDQAFKTLSTEFRDGRLTTTQWRASQQALLFGDRAPNTSFLRFQKRLIPLVTALDQLLDTVAEYTLIFNDIDAISTNSDAPAPTPGEVPVIREVISANRPMRLNYKEEWAKYRAQTEQFNQHH